MPRVAPPNWALVVNSERTNVVLGGAIEAAENFTKISPGSTNINSAIAQTAFRLKKLSLVLLVGPGAGWIKPTVFGGYPSQNNSDCIARRYSPPNRILVYFYQPTLKSIYNFVRIVIIWNDFKQRQWNNSHNPPNYLFFLYLLKRE
jgi:hypothetical protein